jgi:acyl-CoA synthetase (AMP-forming)/AMP-acid ligase II
MRLDWLLDRFGSAAERQAFIVEDRSCTYGSLVQLIVTFEQRLRSEGIRPGDRVVILGDYSPESFCLLIALARNNNTVIPLTRESVVELSTALAISGCEWIFEFAPGIAEPSLTPKRVATDNQMISDFIVSGASGLVFYSSGSTGNPKGILHDLERVASKFLEPRAPVVAIPFLMFDHFGGFNTILAITSGLGTVVTVSERSVSNVCRAIQKHRVTLLPTTPSFLSLMIAAKAHKNFDLSSLRRITYGTEMMPQATLDRVAEALPDVVLQQTYGLSEVGVLASKSRGDGSLWLKIGGEGFQTKVIDGVLWVKSAFSMIGYLNSRSCFDADGWFNTQDRVEVDGDYLRILGRTTDVINVGGQKVYPAEIENVIISLPNVVDATVYGQRNPLMGQIIVARVVVSEPETEKSLKYRIRKACKAHLASYKAPSMVVVSVDPLHSGRFKKNRSMD